jgi:hypothetical protein
MSTIARAKEKNYLTGRIREKVNAKIFSSFWKKMEASRYGNVTAMLLLLSILGGIAAANANLASWEKLAAVTFASTVCLALFLAVAPMRILFSAAVVAAVVDLSVIFF